ncbi:MAG: segregation/condensation protein A [Deltaproteobacteria bacterium]|nr:segregation/condensation protein A [Deltaproteobacteria bacterium]
MTDNSEYKIKLEIFEGPLDLLLHLIRKNEVDIFDIPIAMITEQYLGYLDMMKALNISVAGDFLVMASTLVHIKSRMLLPEREENGEEEDPRTEITRPLLEYLKFKEIAAELSEREILDRDVFKRRLDADSINEFRTEEPILEVNLFQLMDAFKKIVENIAPDTTLTFKATTWTIKEKTAHIMERLKQNSKIYFKDLFNQDSTISELIVTFLALLELVHIGLVRVFQPDPGMDIQIDAHFQDNEEEDYA